jgi:hypothetical protein
MSHPFHAVTFVCASNDNPAECPICCEPVQNKH